MDWVTRPNPFDVTDRPYCASFIHQYIFIFVGMKRTAAYSESIQASLISLAEGVNFSFLRQTIYQEAEQYLILA